MHNFISNESHTYTPDTPESQTDFQELIYAHSPIRETTFTRAAKISPSIGGNSFIPKEEGESADVASNMNISNCKNNFSCEIEDNSISAAYENSEYSEQAMDFKAINNSCLMKSAEKQRREQVKKKLEERQRLQQMENIKRKEILERTIKRYNEYQNRKIENDKMILMTAEMDANKEAVQDRITLEKLNLDKKRKLQKISYDAIAKWQSLFVMHYEKVAIILKTTDKNTNNCEQYNIISHDLIAKFENIVQKLKHSDVGPHDSVLAQELCYSMQSLAAKLVESIQNKSNKEEKPSPPTQQQQPQQQSDKNSTNVQLIQNIKNNTPQQTQTQAYVKPELKQQQTQQNPMKSQDVPDTHKALHKKFVSVERLNFYTEVMNYFNEKNALIQPLQNDNSMKHYRMACKRIFQITVSSICAVSPQHLRDKFNKLKDFITGRNTRMSASDVHIQDHPLGKDYCLILLASIFVQQGETEVSSNQNAAFPIASIIISLWTNVPEFGKIFLGTLFKQSPYLVPYFMPKLPQQSNDDFCRSLGYKFIDGHFENHNTFLQRQSGIIRLYTAILISSGQQSDGPNHPYGIENGWRWLSNFVKLTPLPDICAASLYEFLKIAGYEMWSLYRVQFKKLLIVIRQQYIAKLGQAEDREPTKLRLEAYLDKILSSNSIEKPQGMLSKSYW